MRKIIWMILFSSVVALSCERSKNQPSSGPEAIPVTIVAVEERKVNRELSLSGIVKPKEEVRLSFKLGGEVKEVFFEESDWVQENAVLARLDQTEIRARVTQAEVEFDKAKRDLERIRTLHEDNVVTLAQFQDATSAFQKAQADLVIARYNLTHSEIRAPFSGRIAFKFVKAGELIPPGTPAFVLVDIREVKVEVGTSDSDIGNIQLGNEAEIQVDAYPSETFTGKVTRKAIAADLTSGTFKVEITVENRQGKLLPGMIAQANLYTQPYQAMLVPIEALFSSKEGKGILFVLDETTDRVHSREVLIGSVRGSKTEVLEGIAPGDKIVAGGTAYLKDGNQVRVVE
jgi:RND family efflux transporter MFP subunit